MATKIVIADDDAAILDAVTLALEDEGYEVATATDEGVLELVARERPSVVLLDVWMSGVDGRDLAQKLKSDPDTSSIPIVIVSANRDIQRIADDAGADGYLAKPFDIDDLLNLIIHHAASNPTLA